MSKTILGLDIGSFKTCAVIAKKDGTNMKVLGVGRSRSRGIKKGVITNIDDAAQSIKKALNDAKMVAGTQFEQVIVSISGSYVKNVDSNGVVNIPNHDIGIKEINRAMQMADHNANIPQEYEKVHILPYNFKVDDQEYIEDPLGMNGGRLEVQAHIITAQKSSLSNLRKAVKSAGLEIDNLVLNSYASSIATLGKDEKELGAVMIDLGSSSCNMAIYLGNSMRYNDFLGVGSANITNDLSMALHTPLKSAEAVKLEYGSLQNDSNDYVELPKIGDENSIHEVSLDVVTNVIFARVEETLMILSKSLEDSGHKGKIGAGIVLTGGLTKLEGIRDLTSAIFDNLPVRLARPKEMDGLFEVLRDPGFSAAVGLIMYGGGYFTPYEVDSNKKLRYKDEVIESGKNVKNSNDDISENMDEVLLAADREDMSLANNRLSAIAEIEEESKFTGFFKRFWHRLTQLF